MTVSLARSTVAQRTQLALESTYGVDPAATYKRLPTLMFKPKADNESHNYRMSGSKFTDVVVPNKEWSSGSFEGALTAGELPFVYSSLYALPPGYPFTPGGSGEVEWVMVPSSNFPDVPATFQAQHGDDSANGIQWGGLTVVDATLEVTRAEAKLSGTFIGFRWSTGHTISAVTDDVENVPLAPGMFTAYMDDTFGTIGTTKLSGLLSWHQQLAGRWGMEWVLDASLGSFRRLVELAPNPTLSLKLEADAQAMDLFATYRSGDTVYLRLTTGAHGPALGATHYKMEMDVPVQVKTLQDYSDEGGTYAVGFEFEPIADEAGAGFSHQLTVVNKVSRL